MMNHIWHNSLSPINCLRAFHILLFAYLLFHCYCYHHYKIPKTLLLLSLLLSPLPPLSYYFATKHFAADTKFPGVVELTTQLLILVNILWLSLCRINKFGLYFTLESCCDPLYLWVIKTFFRCCCRGA